MDQRFIDDKHLKLAVALRTNQLKREQLSSLTYQHVEAALQEMVWKHKQPASIHEAIDDVFRLTANEVVAFLSNQAVIMGSQMKLNDLKDVIGGK
ncbi:MAG: hypothetical protein HFG16_08360 [Erysipelotrichaceae bacterium]|jgi:hypothetical protein|nr:hypothetical protein [Erysipelotrichaceae bacterium]